MTARKLVASAAEWYCDASADRPMPDRSAALDSTVIVRGAAGPRSLRIQVIVTELATDADALAAAVFTPWNASADDSGQA